MSDLPAVIPPVKVKRRFTEKRFVNALIVRTADGEKLTVPASSEANKARTQLIAARATELFTKQIKRWETARLDAKELKDILDAAKKLQELNEAAHGTGGMPDAGDPMTGLGKLVQGAVMAGAAAANGQTVSLAEEMRKLTELGRKATAERQAKEIIVEQEAK